MKTIYSCSQVVDDEEEEIDHSEDDSERASTDGSNLSLTSEDSTDSSDESEEVIDSREKFLIFTMGSLTCTPHQIGIDWRFSKLSVEIVLLRVGQWISSFLFFLWLLKMKHVL